MGRSMKLSKHERTDIFKHIKDVEAELEYMLVREPHEEDYISFLEKQVKHLYSKLENETNEISES